MPSGPLSISELAKRLSRTELEFDRLRHQYETRLGKLKERRQKLESELREIERQIPAEASSGPEPAAPPPKETSVSAAKTGSRMILKDFLIAMIKEAGKPLTIKDLATEVKRRKYPTKSKNIRDLVQVRVYDMAKKGLLAHANGQPGFVVRLNSQPGTATTMARGKKGRGRKAKVVQAPVRTGSRGGQPPLREVLTKILEKCREPIGGGELAEMALKTGYMSTSKSFRDVVWANLAAMKGVEHVKGEGYRLKKR
jgi:hypothetical protein